MFNATHGCYLINNDVCSVVCFLAQVGPLGASDSLTDLCAVSLIPPQASCAVQ